MKRALLAITLLYTFSIEEVQAKNNSALVNQEYTVTDASNTKEDYGLVTEAYKWLGSRKFTGLPGPWCADSVSYWLREVGKPPLPGRMAYDAIRYGRVVTSPKRGDLVVMATRRGRYGHVGVVVEPRDGEVLIISGNWMNRVMESVISIRSVTAFVRPT